MSGTDETENAVIDMDSTDDRNTIDIQELAEQYKQEYTPRPFSIQLLITLGFIFGPVFLLFEILFTNFMAILGDLAVVIFGSISGIFFLAIIIRAWQESRKYS